MKWCPSCKTYQREIDKKCPNCGEDLQNNDYDPGEGEPNDDNKLVEASEGKSE